MRLSLRLAIITFALSLGFGCGDDSDDGGSTGVTPTPTPNSGASLDDLSSAYTNNCAACHARCGGNVGGSKVLAGTSLTRDQFAAVVRAGKGNMPKFTTSQYSDTDLTSDHEICAAQ